MRGSRAGARFPLRLGPSPWRCAPVPPPKRPGGGTWARFARGGFSEHRARSAPLPTCGGGAGGGGVPRARDQASTFTNTLLQPNTILQGNTMATTESAAAVSPGRLFIGGEWVDAASGRTFDSVNPATGEVLTQVAEGDAADVDRAVAAARRAFDEGKWSGMDARKRGKLLFAIADALEARADDLARLETMDNGKPVREARMFDVEGAIECFRYYGGWADKIDGDVIPVPGPFLNYTRRESIGVCGQIIPWNYPIQMAAWKVAPALACGNTVVLKPAEQTPLTALELARACAEAGLPAGVLNVVPGFGETAGAALVAHPDVDKIAFTGSTAVGKIIQKQAADTLKKVSLELGGKSPNIVLD